MIHHELFRQIPHVLPLVPQAGDGFLHRCRQFLKSEGLLGRETLGAEDYLRLLHVPGDGIQMFLQPILTDFKAELARGLLFQVMSLIYNQVVVFGNEAPAPGQV